MTQNEREEEVHKGIMYIVWKVLTGSQIPIRRSRKSKKRET